MSKLNIFQTFGIVIIIIIICACAAKGYSDAYFKKDNHNIEYVVKHDTIRDTIPYPVIRYDSAIYNKCDSLSEALFIANYKLNRIAEYNRIAGQRNNIKYLRGWINRTLK